MGKPTIGGTLGYALGSVFTFGTGPGRKPGFGTNSNSVLSKAAAIPKRIQEAVIPVDLNQMDPIGHKMATYKPSFTRVIPLDDDLGSITLRIYESRKLIERKLEIYDADLVSLIGVSSALLPKLSLEGIDLSESSLTAYATAKSVNDAQDYLNGKLAESAGNKQAKQEPAEKSVPKEEATEAPPKPEVKVSSEEAESPAVTVKPSKGKGKAVYIGRFVKSGTDKRKSHEKDKGSGKPREYEQFFVDIENSELEWAETRVWGTDLERAIKECQVKPGEMIEIKNLGRTPVEIPDGKGGTKNAHKTCFSVTKL